MMEIIWAQLDFVLAALCSGMLVMLGYDVIRIFRLLFQKHVIIKNGMDLIYWSFMSIPVYLIFFQYNEGQIRWYGLVSLLGGALLYQQGISAPIRRRLRGKIIECMFRIAGKRKVR